jgi:DNA-binding NtrC family response regulator
VDDDPAIRTTVRDVLEMLDVIVTTAPNGRQALKMCDGTCPFDIVIADVVMPEIGGIQLVEMLGEQWPNLPVVLMTGLDSMVDTVVDAGAVALVKPFSSEQLWRVVEETVKDAKRRSELRKPGASRRS